MGDDGAITSEQAVDEAIAESARFEADEDQITSTEEIENLLKAGYPLVYVVSHEEFRVERALRDFARDKERKTFIWTITEGWQTAGEGGHDITDPLKALDFMLQSDVNALYILKDFHPYLKDPTIVRRLRDIRLEFKRSSLYKNCVLSSPVTEIPDDLEKEIAVVDFDLPNKKEIRKVLKRFLKGVADDPRLETQLDERQRERFADAALGLTELEAENVFAKSMVQEQKLDIDVILSEKEQIIRKSGILEFLHADETVGGIGGLGVLKDWLQKRSKALTQEARDFGLPQPKGILLLGVPGCGKSLTAKAIGRLWQLPLLRLDVGRVFGSLVGASEENIRRACATAEAVAPSLLWLDELEKGLSGTQSSGQSDAGTAARVFGTFITWLQEKTSPVFVIATANNVHQLPPELLRKGRFDEIFFVDLPMPEERKQIFRIHIEKRDRDPADFDLDALVEASEGYSGSEIEQAVIAALFDAFDLGQELTTTGLLEAIEETVPLSQTMQEDITTMREWARSRARFASKEMKQRDEEAAPRQIEL